MAMTDDATPTLPDYVLRAIERASEDDRLWFAAHPSRRWRLRDAHLFEFVDDDDDVFGKLPEGWTRRAIVIQHAPGIRQRWPCCVEDSRPNSGERGEPSETAIRQLFERHASNEVKQLARDYRQAYRKVRTSP